MTPTPSFPNASRTTRSINVDNGRKWIPIMIGTYVGLVVTWIALALFY